MQIATGGRGNEDKNLALLPTGLCSFLVDVFSKIDYTFRREKFLHSLWQYVRHDYNITNGLHDSLIPSFLLHHLFSIWLWTDAFPSSSCENNADQHSWILFLVILVAVGSLSPQGCHYQVLWYLSKDQSRIIRFLLANFKTNFLIRAYCDFSLWAVPSSLLFHVKCTGLIGEFQHSLTRFWSNVQ